MPAAALLFPAAATLGVSEELKAAQTPKMVPRDAAPSLLLKPCPPLRFSGWTNRSVGGSHGLSCNFRLRILYCLVLFQFQAGRNRSVGGSHASGCHSN